MIAPQILPYKVEKTANLAVSFADMDTQEYNSYILKIQAISFQYELVTYLSQQKASKRKPIAIMRMGFLVMDMNINLFNS